MNNPVNKMCKLGKQQAKERQSNLKQTTRANLRDDDSNTHAQSEPLLANRTFPS